MIRSQTYNLYKNDWQAEDDVETVTLTPPAGQGSAYNAAKAKLTELSKRELAMLGNEIMLAAFEQAFILYDVTLNSLQPEARYLITRADGSKWNVSHAVRCKHDTQWVCLTSRER